MAKDGSVAEFEVFAIICENIPQPPLALRGHA